MSGTWAQERPAAGPEVMSIQGFVVIEELRTGDRWSRRAVGSDGLLRRPR